MQLTKSSVGILLATAVVAFFIGRLTSPTASGLQDRAVAISSPVGSSESSKPSKQPFFEQSNRPPLSTGVASASPVPMTAAEFRSEMGRSRSGVSGAASIRRTAALMERLAVSDLGALASDLFRSSDSKVGNGSVQMLMGVYAEKDPEAAWAFAITLPAGQERTVALTVVANAISSENPERAVALAATVPDENIKQNVFAMTVSQLAQRDPQRAFAMIQNEKASVGSDVRRMHLGGLFSVWAAKDLEAARAAASQLTGRSAQEANGAILQALAQTKPEEAWKIATSMQSTEKNPYGDARLQLLSTWGQKDPRAAAMAASEISDSAYRSQALTQVMQPWANKDFDAALQHALTIRNPTERSDVLRAISGGARKGNQDQMLTAILDYMPPGDNFQNSVAQIFNTWVNTDPKEASEAIFRLPPGKVANQAAGQVASQWAQAGNPSESLAWSLRLPEGEIRRTAVESTFRVWSSSDPAAAKSAAAGLPPEERRRAEDAVAQAWARKDPQAVIAWAATMQNADQRQNIVRDATRAWTEKAPEAAARYVDSLPAADRNAAMPAVVERWAAKDVLSAQAWLEKQPSGTGKNEAIRSLTRRIADEDPPSALQLAETITDPKVRDQQRESIAKTWLRNEPVVAKNWITTSNLPPEARDRLLR